MAAMAFACWSMWAVPTRAQPLNAAPLVHAHIERSVARAPLGLADSTATGKHRGGGLLIVGAAVGAAVGNQVLGSPKGWPRTAGGFASRVGDQLAFAIVEESVRAAVTASVDWVPDTLPCRRATSHPTRVGLVRRTTCAVRQTAQMRTPDGRARPNLPFATGVVLASAASASWRPERKSAVTARALVATRIAIVFGASAGTKLVVTWWRDRATSRQSP